MRGNAIAQKFVEPINVAHGADDIEMVPIPIELAGTFPFLPAFVVGSRIGSSTGQISSSGSELRLDELREEEFIQVGRLRQPRERSPRRLPLVLESKSVDTSP